MLEKGGETQLRQLSLAQQNCSYILIEMGDGIAEINRGLILDLTRPIIRGTRVENFGKPPERHLVCHTKVL